MKNLHIHTETVSHFGQNARVLINTDEKRICMVDPGAELDRLLSVIDFNNYTVESIFLTHCHIDHGGAVKPLLNFFKSRNLEKPKLYYHSKEWIVGKNIENYAIQCGFGEGCYFNVPNADIKTDDLSEFSIGNITGKLLFTPGHAPGHMALYFDKVNLTLTGNHHTKTDKNRVLLSGDALFKESVGRTDLPLSNPDDLIKSIQEQLYTLPDDTLVLPGHGPNTSIAYEKQFNPFVRGTV